MVCINAVRNQRTATFLPCGWLSGWKRLRILVNDQLPLFNCIDQSRRVVQIKIDTVCSAYFAVDRCIAGESPFSKPKRFDDWETKSLDDRRKDYASAELVTVLKLRVLDVVKGKELFTVCWMIPNPLHHILTKRTNTTDQAESQIGSRFPKQIKRIQ